MRIVIQRAARASVSIAGEKVASIGRGLMVLVGVEEGDTEADARWLAAKVFDDEAGVMNLSVEQTHGGILAVSQFTLTASTRKGNRPSYIRAAGHATATALYNLYCSLLAQSTEIAGVGRGVFGADMQVELVNDGPVTIIIDSRLKE